MHALIFLLSDGQLLFSLFLLNEACSGKKIDFLPIWELEEVPEALKPEIDIRSYQCKYLNSESENSDHSLIINVHHVNLFEKLAKFHNFFFFVCRAFSNVHDIDVLITSAHHSLFELWREEQVWSFHSISSGSIILPEMKLDLQTQDLSSCRSHFTS